MTLLLFLKFSSPTSSAENRLAPIHIEVLRPAQPGQIEHWFEQKNLYHSPPKPELKWATETGDEAKNFFSGEPEVCIT